LCREALSIHREVGDLRSEGATLGTLAEALAAQDRDAEAAQALESALAIHRRIGNRRYEAVHGCHLASFLVASDAGRARRLWREGAAVLRAMNDAAALDLMARHLRRACEKAGVPAFEEDPA
jgi:hypothetical protein